MSDIEIVLTPAPSISIEPGGAPGPAGKDAYQTWIDEGNTGTPQDFLDSLKGEPGEDADPADITAEIEAYAAPIVHTHAITDVTGLSAALDEKADTSALDEKANTADLGTAAAADSADFATAAQGALADTAVQPADLDAYVPETRTINGQPLSADIVIETGGGTPTLDEVLAEGSTAADKPITLTSTPIPGVDLQTQVAAGSVVLSRTDRPTTYLIPGALAFHKPGWLATANLVPSGDADAGDTWTLPEGGGVLLAADASDFATAAQGALADSAVQPADLSAAIAGVVDSAPGALDTLNELAAALGDDDDFAGTVTNALALKADSAGLATVATTGAYGDLTGKPTLGTAAPLNVPASGNAAAGEVVKGSDTRLSDARTPLAHTHTASAITDFNTAADARVVAGITGKLDTSAAPELIRDTIGTALVPGTNITVTVNDAGDTITIGETVSPIAAGSANNPHTTQGAARNSALPKNFWQYTGTAGVDDPTNWLPIDEWNSA